MSGHASMGAAPACWNWALSRLCRAVGTWRSPGDICGFQRPQSAAHLQGSLTWGWGGSGREAMLLPDDPLRPRPSGVFTSYSPFSFFFNSCTLAYGSSHLSHNCSNVDPLPHCARLGIEPSLHSNPSRGQSNSYPTVPRQELPLPSFNASSKQPLGQGAFPRGCLPQHPPVVAASSTSTQPTLCCLLSLLLMSGAALASSPFENYKAERREVTKQALPRTP